MKERLDAVYGDSFPSMATVNNWFNEFQRGPTSVFAEPRLGAPKTATTEDNVGKIFDFVLADRRLKLRKIAERVGISKDRVGHMFKRNSKEFLRRFVKVNETWIHCYTPETLGTVETVDFTRRTCSEEGEDCPIDRKGDGHRFFFFLGFTR
ncbi:uncharacterized protein LOC118748298 [Rhagoletis pomonella]|uniref:uncharacterized protein LOC118748298 n=1 Tax=Rhagoletis pomonella TaxID=28610 RepID=UPI00177B0D87|nr:uncharacterized protein LOC118748298 [Rhagoletis pomonella]